MQNGALSNGGNLSLIFAIYPSLNFLLTSNRNLFETRLVLECMFCYNLFENFNKQGRLVSKTHNSHWYVFGRFSLIWGYFQNLWSRRFWGLMKNCVALKHLKKPEVTFILWKNFVQCALSIFVCLFVCLFCHLCFYTEVS